MKKTNLIIVSITFIIAIAALAIGIAALVEALMTNSKSNFGSINMTSFTASENSVVEESLTAQLLFAESFTPNSVGATYPYSLSYMEIFPWTSSYSGFTTLPFSTFTLTRIGSLVNCTLATITGTTNTTVISSITSLPSQFVPAQSTITFTINGVVQGQTENVVLMQISNGIINFYGINGSLSSGITVTINPGTVSWVVASSISP